VVRAAESFGEHERIAGLPRRRHRSEDPIEPALGVVALRREAYGEPAGQRAGRVQPLQGAVLPGGDPGGVGGSSVLVHPQPAEPQSGAGQGVVVITFESGARRRIEPAPSPLQVTLAPESVFARCQCLAQVGDARCGPC
jgi:hypothetical protein